MGKNMVVKHMYSTTVQSKYINEKISENTLTRRCIFHRSCPGFEACRLTRPYIREGKQGRETGGSLRSSKVISKSLILLSRSQLSNGHDKSKSRTKREWTDMTNGPEALCPSKANSLQEFANSNRQPSTATSPSSVSFLLTPLLCLAVPIQYLMLIAAAKIADAWNT